MLYVMFSVLLFFIGMIFFIIGYLGKYELSKGGYLDDDSVVMVNKEKEELSQKVEEADKVLGELNKFSTYISKEMEDKHKELLFLYQLIDEKQENLKKTEKEKNTASVEKVTKTIEKKVKTEKKEKPIEIENNENKNNKKENTVIEEKEDTEDEKVSYSTINDELKLKNILKTNHTIQEKVKALYSMGKTVGEIAQILKKGKNEIRLMIDMEKKG